MPQQKVDSPEKKREGHSSDRYYALLNSLDDAVLIHDMSGNFIEANTAALQRLGYTRDELLDIGPKEIDASEYASLVDKRIEKIRKNGHLVFESVHLTKDGTKIPVEIASSVADYDGQQVIISVARDITKRMQYKKALEASQERLRFVVEGAGLGTWDWNIETGEVVFNDKWANMIGYDLSEIESNLDAWKKRVQPDDLPKVMDTLNKHLEGETDYYASEHRVKAKDGNWVWIEDRGKVVERKENGQPLRATGIHLNITERKYAQENLQKERSQLLEIFNSIDEIIYVSDPESYEVLFVNQYLKEKFGRDLVGGKCYEEFQGFDKPCDFCTNEIILEHPGEPYQWEYHNPILDVDLLVTDRTIRWPDGRQVRFEIAIDITDQKRAERNLKESNRKLELYTSLLKHDLANDIQVLINRLEYVEMLEDPQDMKTQYKQVRAASKRMAKLLKIFAESRTGENDGLIDIIETSIEHSKEANPGLVISTEMVGNRRKLNRKMGELVGPVFDNLLRNVVQHAGSNAHVSIEISEDKDDVIVMVSDDGPGIPESMRSKLFRQKYSGTRGMGLSLCKRVVEAYEGTFTLHESGSDGTTFEIRLPKDLDTS
ncbi:MAG: PAS domain S-box protein [Candidatus Thorarchaeota archaeon]